MKYFLNEAHWARTFSIICLSGLLYSSCTKKTNYSIIPAITYNSFTKFCSGSTTDSAFLRVNFTDGDGDIGYPTNDASAPSDFYIIPLFDSAGIFKPLPVSISSGTDTLTFAYRIPYITPSGTDKSLNGIIQINLENAFVQFKTILTILQSRGFIINQFKFQVWIYDRAGHKSNVLITPIVQSCG